jgi:hypothetical protein
MSILKEGVNLTVGGAVKFPGGYMHPESFRNLWGEEAYQELLERPRVVCEYDYEDEDETTFNL